MFSFYSLNWALSVKSLGGLMSNIQKLVSLKELLGVKFWKIITGSSTRIRGFICLHRHFCLKWNFVMSDFIWIITSCNIYLNNWVVISKQLDIGLKGIVYLHADNKTIELYYVAFSCQFLRNDMWRLCLSLASICICQFPVLCQV